MTLKEGSKNPRDRHTIHRVESTDPKYNKKNGPYLPENVPSFLIKEQEVNIRISTMCIYSLL